ncbi:MAG: hypothetical protein EP338_11485 [Bacteroidetes bacterium]|nr:MAG: hypothetical protein EP338_11485 [Bacteroidota bacterium]
MNLQALFFKYFEQDLEANLHLLRSLETHENQIDQEILKQFSHLLNAHHIWNCRLYQQIEESGWWDSHSPYHFERLARDNYQQTLNYLEHQAPFNQVHYYLEDEVQTEGLSADILMQILFHSNYHRAQIIQLLKRQSIQAGSFRPNFG